MIDGALSIRRPSTGVDNQCKHKIGNPSIIEHVYATLPQFGLRAFQRSMSVDIGDPPQAGAWSTP